MAKQKGFGIAVILIIIIAGAVGYGSFVFTKKNDGPVEQAAEAVLKSHGIDIDFSPDDDGDNN